jgi:uncharacterized protein (DUF305 family)
MKDRLASVTVATVTGLTLAACAGGVAEQPAAPESAGFNQADADFLPAMNQLLGQATTLAETATQKASSPQVKNVAASMNAAHYPQFDQVVARMEEAGKQAGLNHPHDHGESAHAIPGYIPESDVDRMDAARGRKFDRTFVTLMLRHHDGAIALTRTEQAQGRHQPTKDLARQIEATLRQHRQELARLTGSTTS